MSITGVGGSSVPDAIGPDDIDAFGPALDAETEALVALSPTLSGELGRLVGEEGYVIERGDRTRIDTDERRIVVGEGTDDPVALVSLLAGALGSEEAVAPEWSGTEFVETVIEEIDAGGGPDLLADDLGLDALEPGSADLVTLRDLFIAIDEAEKKSRREDSEAPLFDAGSGGVQGLLAF